MSKNVIKFSTNTITRSTANRNAHFHTAKRKTNSIFFFEVRRWYNISPTSGHSVFIAIFICVCIILYRVKERSLAIGPCRCSSCGYFNFCWCSRDYPPLPTPATTRTLKSTRKFHHYLYHPITPKTGTTLENFPSNTSSMRYFNWVLTNSMLNTI